ncbi:uncharacterized protein B0J16DRAFT_331028 [Fusarium flagelliforme]|uniref:uncharacterized protein n=1 Tax=Fusarium flagelliforme TaxID=2675880 RepID=UPI001E8D95E3|nr:uncharacterized protein B0J16DRAFT_331028 [Fusarium flagelliforme]KAH7198730.1 hypothetical protein B0J16DRAFT_331028 [Fusarium flagelliforme]
MTYPIDIPAQQSYRPIPTADLSPYPEDEGPYMGYTEIFENGLVHNLVSAGSGKFIEVQPQFKLPFFSFTIVKHNARGVTTIGFGSRDLKRFFSESLALNPVGPEPLTLNIEQVLCHYDALCHILRERANYGTRFDDTFNEIRLLVNDILLESFLYDGLDIDHLHRQNIISADLFQEIQPRYNDFLSGPGEYFELGAFTQEMEEEYERVQNTQIGTFARMGREDLLRGFCEPLLRSKNTRIFYDEELLYEILQNRFWDTYEYMLNVIERSRLLERNVRCRDPSDITYDPLYMAIKLDHCPTVQYLIQNKHKSFEGYIKGAANYSDRLFTPLLAAVRWQKVDVIRLLLQEAPVYYSMLPQALEFAKETGFYRMMDVVADLTTENASTFAHKSARYPGPKAPQSQIMGGMAPSITITPSPYGNSNVSGISNGLQDLSQGQMTLDGSDPFPQSPEISQLLTNPSLEGKDLGSFDSGIGMETSFEFPTSPWTPAIKDDHTPRESIDQPTEALGQLSPVPMPPSWGDNGPLLAEDSDFEKFFGQPTETLDPTSLTSTRENKRPRLEMDFNFEAISSETTETPGQRDLTPIPPDNKRPRLAMKFNFEAISSQTTKTPGQSSPDPPRSTQDYNGSLLVTVSDFENTFGHSTDAQDQMIQSPFLLSFNYNGPATGFDVVNMSNGFAYDANGSIAPSAFPTPPAFSTPPTENVEDVLLQTDIPPWTPQCKDDHPTPSKTELMGEPPSSPPRCSHCEKTFANMSSRNKHERQACPNKTIPRLPCRYAHLGCKNAPKNEDNRKSHERKWCKFRPNHPKAGRKSTT